MTELSSAPTALAARPGPAVRQRRLRILHITDNLGAGGLEQVVVTLCRAMDRTRFEPSVLCLSFIGVLAEKLADVGVPVMQLPRAPGRAKYLAFRGVARVIREQRIDVVHTHNTGPFLDGGLAALATGVRTLVHTEHGRVFPDRLRWMVAEHALSHLAYRIVGVSEPTIRNLARYERISPRKLALIPNGIELDVYAAHVDRQRKRRELGLPESGPILGVTSRLAEPKGVTHLLKALPSLLARFSDLTVLIAGTGDLADALAAEARELGVADRVRFLGLRLDVPELLPLFDVYALPSISEGLPMSLIEAMAAGCAVVATDVGGVGSLVRSEQTGMLVPPRAPEAMAAAIARLLLDDRLRKRVSEAGRRAAHDSYSASAMARRYERLYLREAQDPAPG